MNDSYAPVKSRYTVMVEPEFGEAEEVTTTYFKEGAFFYAQEKNKKDEGFYWVASDEMDRSYPEQLARGIDMGLTRAGISEAFEALSELLSGMGHAHRRNVAHAVMKRLSKEESFGLMEVEEAVLAAFEDVRITTDEGDLPGGVFIP